MSKIKNVTKNLVKCLNCLSDVAIEAIEIAEIAVDKDDKSTKHKIEHAEKITKAIHKGLDAIERRMEEESSDDSCNESPQGTDESLDTSGADEESDEYQSADSEIEMIKPQIQRQNAIVEKKC